MRFFACWSLIAAIVIRMYTIKTKPPWYSREHLVFSCYLSQSLLILCFHIVYFAHFMNVQSANIKLACERKHPVLREYLRMCTIKRLKFESVYWDFLRYDDAIFSKW